jgi:hypothetical protein
MDIFDQITRFKRLDYMVRTRSTGTPAELAGKLGISTSQVYQIIRLLKIKWEAPIYYSRTYQSYCYRGNVKFLLEFRTMDDSLE